MILLYRFIYAFKFFMSTVVHAVLQKFYKILMNKNTFKNYFLFTATTLPIQNDGNDCAKWHNNFFKSIFKK